jgi:MFS transporter, DHA1 family, tetracycline resistance protein
VETQPYMPPPAKREALRFIFGLVLLDVVGLTMLMPVSAYIVRAYSADALSVRMLTVINAAAQFMAAPLLGRLSEPSTANGSAHAVGSDCGIVMLH